MERVSTVYMVARISSYADLDKFKVYQSYERALEAFKAEIGQVILTAINDSAVDKTNLFDFLKEIYSNIYLEDLGDNMDCPCKIPDSANEFIANSGNCIIFSLNDDDRIELRHIEMIS